ncbi:MAG: TIGR04219 family outer membrane beta-barrel protein [Aquificaceae bacterium]|nr:TIGR04219 family outer membrane beta-barrel protein [Aquificaceae bacterium]
MLLPAFSFAISVEGSIGVWNQDPSGYISYKGDQIDVDSNLRYGKKTRPMGRLKIDMPSILPNIYLMATPSRFEAIGQKDTSFTFGGQTYQANVPFYSKTRLDHYDIALYYGIPSLKKLTNGVLSAELGLNVRIMDLYAKVEQSQNNISESKSLTVPIPMLYTGLQIRPVNLLSMEGELRGVAYNSNHYYDLIGRLKVKPVKYVFLAGGYRYQELKIDVSDVKSKVKLKGPFVEAGFEF